MRLYPKKLRSIEDLEREKKKLLRESKRMEDDSFLSVETIFKKKKGGAGGSDVVGISSVLDFIPVSNPVVDILLKFIKRKISNKQNEDSAYVESTPKKNRLKSLAIEFIGGYLKWKAIELSYKGLKHLLSKKKTGSN